MKSNSYINIWKSVIGLTTSENHPTSENHLSDVGMYNNRFQNVNVGI